MNQQASSAKASSPRNGIAVRLAALLRAKGRGVPSLRLFSLLLLATTAVIALGANSALAAPPSEFGEEGTGAGELQTPQGIAVDQETGDVYINDFNNSRGDRFGSEGEFELAFGWGVVDGAEELQTCGPQAPLPTITCRDGILGFSPGPGQFGLGPAGAAVDNSGGSSQGDVYFNDSPRRITKFGPQGEFLFMIGGGVDQGGGTPSNPGNLCTAAFIANGDSCGPATAGSGPSEFESLGRSPLAVDSAGTLYVGDNERVQKFSPSGAFEGEIALPGVIAEKIAIDSADDIYVMGSGLSGVHKYDSTGTELGAPRATSASPENSTITVGPSDQLIVAEGGSEGSEHLSAYDSTGKQLWSLPGSNQYDSGIAYGQAIERIYALFGSTVRLISPPPPGPLVLPGSESAEEVGTTSAKLGASINPEGGEETTYAFQYVDDQSFTTEGGFASPDTEETTPEELTGGPFEDQAAAASLSALLPGTTYHFRVVVTNKASQTAAGLDQTFTTLPAVSIDASYAFAVTDTDAILGTELNPHGLPTTYHFEYDTVGYVEGEAPHGTSLPVPDGSAGSGTGDVTRTAPLSGLEPSTTYHFRVVAENSLGKIEGPDRVFTTQGAATSLLPDGRAWELVSPPDKQGAALEGIGGPFGEGAAIQAAADGSSLTYVARAPITAEPPNNRSLANSQLLAHRSATGAWQTQDIGIPHGAPVGFGSSATSEYQLFSPDLSSAAIQPQGATPLSDQATEPTPYLRQSDGSFTPILTAANVPPGVQFGGTASGAGGPVFITGTPDLSHVLFESPKALTDEFSSTYEPTYDTQVYPYNIYEWNAGALTLVSQVPSDTATFCGGVGPDCVAASEKELTANVGYRSRQTRGAISGDGSRVVFVAGSGGTEHLYLRDLIRNESVQLDALQGGSGGTGKDRAVFQIASADGSRVFFTQQRRLTPGSTARQAKPDLYMCQIEKFEGHLVCALTDLTANTVDPSEPAGLLGAVIGTSEDASSVYFVANGALTIGEGAVDGDCGQTGEPAEERCNLYRYDTVAATLRLIAVLSGADSNDWDPGNEEDLGGLTGRVSPNGRYLAFMSQLPLTGYDNRDAKTGVRDQEVYLYDSAADGGEGKVICPSCNPTGARPTGVVATVSPGLLVDRGHNWGGTGGPTSATLAANIPGWTNIKNVKATYQSRFLSNSGRLFFNAADALVPGDTNGTFDVYQFEFPQGPGQPASSTCTTASLTYSPASGGCASLISSGASPEESAFLDASETGDDVFFLTAAKLLPRDVDTALDLYDARVGGGEPAPVNPVECSGDACQQPISPPNDPTPGSLTFNGAGNLLECPKSEKPQQGKCVKQKAKKKHHKKKSHKKHAKKRANSYHGGAK